VKSVSSRRIAARSSGAASASIANITAIIASKTARFAIPEAEHDESIGESYHTWATNPPGITGENKKMRGIMQLPFWRPAMESLESQLKSNEG
jgi:hypothetical protein